MVFLKVFSSFIRRFRAFFPEFRNKSGKNFRSHVPKMGTYGSKRLRITKIRFSHYMCGVVNEGGCLI